MSEWTYIKIGDRRAALKRKIMSLITDTWDGERTIENASTAAIDLIRADALEEAARVAETCEWWTVPLKDDDERAPIAAAIRALKATP